MTQPNRPPRTVRRARALAAFAATGCFAVAAVTVALRHDSAPAARSAPAEADAVAQSYSPYCQTSRGVCTLPTALPIGAPCDCNGDPGRIVP